MRVWTRFICITSALYMCSFGSDSILSAEAIAGGRTLAAELKQHHASTLTSCVRDLPQFSDPLVDPAELERLMQGYFKACHYDLSAIDSVYEAEVRDSRWAAPVERKLQEVAAGFEGLETTGECRKSICRIDFQKPQNGWTLQQMLDFDHKLLPQLKGTPTAVGVSAVPFQGGIRQYFYSEVLPAAFLQPLRRKIGK